MQVCPPFFNELIGDSVRTWTFEVFWGEFLTIHSVTTLEEIERVSNFKQVVDVASNGSEVVASDQGESKICRFSKAAGRWLLSDNYGAEPRGSNDGSVEQMRMNEPIGSRVVILQ